MELPTPLERAPANLIPGVEIWLKREDVHELGAFKWRGALATVAAYADEGVETVVTASTGNHGAATAWAAARHDMRAIVFAPEGASRVKTALIERHGAELRFAGADMDESKELARAYTATLSARFFEDGAEPAQLVGYGEIATELLDALPAPPATVVVPLGNGALAAGIGTVLAERAPDSRLICVVSDAAPVMAWSLAAGRAVDCDRSDTFADGLAVRVAIPYAVEVLSPLVDDVVEVSERELAEAVAHLDAAGIRAEGAGAAALAGARAVDSREGSVVLIVTGRNIEGELHRRAVEHPETFAGRREHG